MLSNEALLFFFTRGAGAEVAPALVVKFRAAEQRRGELPLGYAAIMVRNFKVDTVRAEERAVRAAERAVIEAAERIEAERKVDEFVAACLQFDALMTLEVVNRLSVKQRESLDMLRAVVVDGTPLLEVAARHGLKPDAAYQRISRVRILMRPVVTAMGFTALLSVAINNRLSPSGGAVNYR